MLSSIGVGVGGGSKAGGKTGSTVKGNIRTISPGRNRLNCQILAYLLTIDLLYGTGCLSY